MGSPKDGSAFQNTLTTIKWIEIINKEFSYFYTSRTDFSKTTDSITR